MYNEDNEGLKFAYSLLGACFGLWVSAVFTLGLSSVNRFLFLFGLLCLMLSTILFAVNSLGRKSKNNSPSCCRGDYENGGKEMKRIGESEVDCHDKGICD